MTDVSCYNIISSSSSNSFKGRRRRGSYSSSSSRSRTPPKKEKERRKSTTEELLGAVGLGGLAGAVLGRNKDKDRSRSRSSDRSRRSRGGRSRKSSSDRSRNNRSKSRGPNKGQISQALKAAVLAGAGEAFRARGEKGGWGGEKGKRVLTAALAAGGVNGLTTTARDSDDHKKRDVVGSALAGLAANRVINGPRSKSRGRDRDESPDDRGRSQSRGLKDVAAGGVVAAAAKKAYDSIRSRSRGRARSRSSSYDSRDSRQSRKPPKRSRSQSVSAFAAKGLAALGLKDQADKLDPDRDRNRDRDRDRDYDRESHRQRPSNDDYYYDDGRSSRNGGYGYNESANVGTIQPHYNGQPYGGPRSSSVPGATHSGYKLDYGPRHTGDPETDSDSDLGSSTDDEKNIKKSRKKLFLTGGLATVATIHAANSVYGSMKKREERYKALKQGDISPAQAKTEKNKNRLQDVASIGIAGLGIKGAYSEWKETRNKSLQIDQEQEKRKRHAAKREARRRKAYLSANSYADSGFTGSMPDLTHLPPDPYPHSAPVYGQPPYSYGTGGSFIYSDGNPYGALSRPPGFVPTPPPPPQAPPQAYGEPFNNPPFRPDTR